jgi:GDPmannose 4,6-dehydratase
MKKALITGITGQDGSYLAELLLDKGYEVFAIIRRASTFNTGRINHLFKDIHTEGNKLHLIYGDLTDGSSVNKIVRDVNPDEIYNLGAQSHVRVSFDIPENTADVNALGTLRLLEAIRDNNLTEKTKFYQASTSELFGQVQETPQSETTPFYPRSPYGVAKLYAYWIVKNYRESYNLYACNGILFNHESPRRGETFVTRKITLALARMKLGLQDKLFLGNLDAKRDWGYAKDYVEMMWLMLQQEKPDDYVIGTGETHSIREFLEIAIDYLGLDIKSNGKTGIEEKYLNDAGLGKIEIDPRYFRPAEVELLLSNPKKAEEKLGWKAKTKFKELVILMIDNDLELAKKEKILNENKINEI